jgi:hypothetical protein
VTGERDEGCIGREALGDDVQVRDRDARLDAVDREPRLVEALDVEIRKAREERVVDLERGARMAAIGVEPIDDPPGGVPDDDGGLARAVVQARDTVRELAVLSLPFVGAPRKKALRRALRTTALRMRFSTSVEAGRPPCWSCSVSTMPRPPGSTTSTSAISDQ